MKMTLGLWASINFCPSWTRVKWTLGENPLTWSLDSHAETFCRLTSVLYNTIAVHIQLYVYSACIVCNMSECYRIDLGNKQRIRKFYFSSEDRYNFNICCGESSLTVRRDLLYYYSGAVRRMLLGNPNTYMYILPFELEYEFFFVKRLLQDKWCQVPKTHLESSKTICELLEIPVEFSCVIPCGNLSLDSQLCKR